MPTTRPTRAALYARCSTGHQDLGLQLDELRAVAAHRGWEVVGIYEDSGISGTERSRPALDALILDCKAGKVDVLVVWKLDRLARSVVRCCTLAESLHAWGVGLVSVRDPNIDSTTPSGKFGLAVLSAVAELERSLIGERVKAGLDRAKAKGKHLGWPRVEMDIRPAVAMLREGHGLKATSDALGVNRGTLRRRLREAGRWPPADHPRPPPSGLRSGFGRASVTTRRDPGGEPSAPAAPLCSAAPAGDASSPEPACRRGLQRSTRWPGGPGAQDRPRS